MLLLHTTNQTNYYCESDSHGCLDGPPLQIIEGEEGGRREQHCSLSYTLVPQIQHVLKYHSPALIHN